MFFGSSGAQLPTELLGSQISQANADRAKASGNLVKAREVVRRGIDEKWWPSVIFYLNRQARCSVSKPTQEKAQKTFGKTIKKLG